jgi:hypothetical protein
VTRSAAFAAAGFFAAGSELDRGAEDFESGSDAESFLFPIHPLMKQSLSVWYHKTFQETMGPNGERVE